MTETDDTKDYDTALSAEPNVTGDFSGLKRAVFGLCTWHPYGILFECTEVLDIVELDLWSSEYHAGFLFKSHLFSSKISNNLQRCSDLYSRLNVLHFHYLKRTLRVKRQRT